MCYGVNLHNQSVEDLSKEDSTRMQTETKIKYFCNIVNCNLTIPAP